MNSGDSIETEFEVVDKLNLVSEEFSEISHRNLFWSDDLKSLNIVVDGVSEGLVILDEWGDEDQFTFNGSDMIRFADLKDYFNFDGSERDQQFDSLNADQLFSDNIDDTIKWLNQEYPEPYLLGTIDWNNI